MRAGLCVVWAGYVILGLSFQFFFSFSFFNFYKQENGKGKSNLRPQI